MNFIVLTDYYHPIVKSGSIIVGDLVNELSLQGHKITIVTFSENQRKKCVITVEGKLQIIRIRSLIRDRKYGRVGRLLAELSYSYQIIRNLKNLQNIRCDGIICYSPSIFYGKAVRWLKKKYNSKAYLVIRDIFPKWTVDTGLLKKGLIYKYFKIVERNLYSSCDVIGIEAKSDLDYFKNYGLNKSIKIEVLNNWGSPLGRIEDDLPSDNALDIQKVNIVYGGNMGDAQDILSLIDSIDYSILGQRAVMTFIGYGDQFEKIKNIINKKNLTNIVLMSTVDRKTYLAYMSKADIGLVSLSKKMSSNNYPLKMIGYMQLSKPILASVNKNNEMIQMIEENNIGLASLASDEKSFNKNLDIMITNEAKRKQQGENALKLFNDRFTVREAVLQISNHFPLLVKMKKLLMVLNTDYALLSHRIDIAIAAKKAGYEVHVACGVTGFKDKIENYGMQVHDIKMSRSGLNIFKELIVFFRIFTLYKRISPSAIHLITIKPIVYGGIAARLLFRRGVIFAISGLGYVFSSKQWKARVIKTIVKPTYKYIFNGRNSKVILQNKVDINYMINKRLLVKDKVVLIPGSGVSLEKYVFVPESKTLNVLMASRLLRDKGVFEFIKASNRVKEVLPNAKFILTGEFDKENPESISEHELKDALESSPVKYIGYTNNIYKEICKCNVAVLPSYREGLPKFLIEAAASGRAAISTDAPGCSEVIDDNKTGLIVPIKNFEALADAIILLLSDENIRYEMAKNARKKAEKIYSINGIIKAHLDLYVV